VERVERGGAGGIRFISLLYRAVARGGFRDFGFPPGGWIPVVEKWRPLFLGLAAFLLFLGYQKVFGNPRCACEPKRLFQKRLIFIGVALSVAFLMTYPYISVWIRR
jgi:hypothetical protein